MMELFLATERRLMERGVYKQAQTQGSGYILGIAEASESPDVENKYITFLGESELGLLQRYRISVEQASGLASRR